MKALSPTMTAAVEFIRRHGTIKRYPGGFWCKPDLECDPRHTFSHGTKTIQALVDRGVAEYVEWQEGRNGRFPIAAKLTEPNTVEVVRLESDAKQ